MSCFFNDTPPTDIYTLSLHDALPIWGSPRLPPAGRAACAAARLRGSRRSPFAEDARLLVERAHRIGRERALREPGARLIGVDVDDRGFGPRIVVADRGDKPAVARWARIGHDEAEVRLPFSAFATQPDASCHVLH